MQLRTKVIILLSVLTLALLAWQFAGNVLVAGSESNRVVSGPERLGEVISASKSNAKQSGTSRTARDEILPWSKNWTEEQYAKFKRARAKFSSDYWPDNKLAIYISDPDPAMDLDNPNVISRLLAREARNKARARYILPKEKAIAYTEKVNTEQAFIVAAFASGSDERGGDLHLTFINEAKARFGDTPDLLYASLMANKSFLTNSDDIKKFRELSPENGIPDLMEAAYWFNQGNHRKAFELVS